MLRGKCRLEPILLQNALPFQIIMLTLHLILATPCKEEALRGKRGRQDTYIMAKAYLALWF